YLSFTLVCVMLIHLLISCSCHASATSEIYTLSLHDALPIWTDPPDSSTEAASNSSLLRSSPVSWPSSSPASSRSPYRWSCGRRWVCGSTRGRSSRESTPSNTRNRPTRSGDDGITRRRRLLLQLPAPPTVG